MPVVRRTYQSLLNEIAELYTATRGAVVKMYWEMGKRIVEVEQGGEARAAYGQRLLPRLSADLTKRFGAGFSTRNLDRMRVFYQQNQILPSMAKLDWTHQMELMRLPDARLRDRLAEQAQRRELTSKELRALVEQERERLEPRTPSDGKHAAPPQLLTPKRGTLGLFQIKTIDETRCMDLGFAAYRPLTETEQRRLSDGQIVRRERDGTLTRAPAATANDLYTYEAAVLRVVDGDTLWMVIHLTPTDWRKEKLRLRGIDCPERGTSGGEAATRYVQTLVREATQIVLTSTKPDKWDRYLCDVYLTPAGGPDVFLNNRLLERGHARRYDDVTPEDWAA